MSDGQVFPVPEALAREAHIDAAAYEAAVARIEADPEGYWRDVAARLDWIKAPTEIKDVSFDKDDFRIRWYHDGTLNVSYNCLDRNVERGLGGKTAIIFEADDGKVTKVSYAELLAAVQALLAATEDLARARGCCKLTLEVLTGNQLALASYLKFGFAPYALDPAAGQASFMQKWL